MVFIQHEKMTNNDTLRRLRYAFDFNDTKMMELFELGGYAATRAEISDWLKRDKDDAFQLLQDQKLAVFLNGLIIKKRGARSEEPPKPEKYLDNNVILRKLKIALNLRDDMMVEVFRRADFDVSKHEISALFRKPTQSQFRECQDQFLRNFIYGLQIKHRRPQQGGEEE